jgi:hypothetical protein
MRHCPRQVTLHLLTAIHFFGSSSGVVSETEVVKIGHLRSVSSELDIFHPCELPGEDRLGAQEFAEHAANCLLIGGICALRQMAHDPRSARTNLASCFRTR